MRRLVHFLISKGRQKCKQYIFIHWRNDVSFLEYIRFPYYNQTPLSPHGGHGADTAHHSDILKIPTIVQTVLAAYGDQLIPKFADRWRLSTYSPGSNRLPNFKFESPSGLGDFVMSDGLAPVLFIVYINIPNGGKTVRVMSHLHCTSKRCYSKSVWNPDQSEKIKGTYYSENRVHFGSFSKRHSKIVILCHSNNRSTYCEPVLGRAITRFGRMATNSKTVLFQIGLEPRSE
ncbi:hypothetical protein AVEN_130767-1 [Araneus ventricosus]|uniref:Uncharacterized protein n=1 Tax=Araneus ventricosus TaxID=182803 RepID=A0A4Y2GGY2_ARAVE|nr:hypothetical protein AVEN_130767-1 [Araneus ventricosus]